MMTPIQIFQKKSKENPDNISIGTFILIILVLVKCSSASDTTSIKTDICAYRFENGRRYHAYKAGAYWYELLADRRMWYLF